MFEQIRQALHDGDWEDFDPLIAEMDPLPLGASAEIKWLVKPSDPKFNGLTRRECAGMLRAHWSEPFEFTQPHDELICQLEGDLTVTLKTGEKINLRDGESAFFPKGISGIWDYHGKPMTELFVFFM